MHFLPTERVALFIDGANLYSASRNLGFDVDYRNPFWNISANRLT